MLSSVKSSAMKFKRSVTRKASSLKSCLSRYKGIMCKIFLGLALIAMIVLLVMYAIQGVDLLSQAVVINHT